MALRRVSYRSAISCRQVYRVDLSISRFKSSALNDSRFANTTNSLILAVRDFIILKVDVEREKAYAYADEADMLNLALWACTAKQWREANRV